MRFHGITMVGKFYIQKLSSLPTWTSTDEGRLVYDIGFKNLYIGTNEKWTKVGGGGFGLPISNFTNNSILEHDNIYFVDTTTGALTGKLPPSPIAGDSITVADLAGSFNNHYFTVLGNGHTIDNNSSYIIKTQNAIVTFVFSGSKWKMSRSGSIIDADYLNGYSASVNTANNKIVVRNNTGDINSNISYNTDISISHLQAIRNSDTIFYSSVDDKIKKNTKAGFLTSLDLNNVSNYPASISNLPDNLVLRDNPGGNFSAGTITATLSGNSDTATKLKNARNINFNGDVSGTFSYDGSVDKNVLISVADDSHNHTNSTIEGVMTSTPSSVVQRDTSGNITANLFKSETTTSNTNIQYIMTQSNITSDSSIKPSSVTDFKSLLGLNNVSNYSASSNNTPDTLVLRAMPDGDFEAGTITANLVGNSSTSSKWLHTIKIQLIGDVTSNEYTFDGSANISIDTTIGSNSHTHPISDITNLNTALDSKLSTATNLGAGTAIDITGTLSGNDVTINHADTSNQLSINNSGRTYIQSVILDSMGHVTGLTSATETVQPTPSSGYRPMDEIASNTHPDYCISSKWAFNHENKIDAHEAKSTNTANHIVLRDTNGDFSAGTITANLIGNVDHSDHATDAISLAGGSATTDSTNGWFISHGNSGWKNSLYNGGIYMDEIGYIKTYNNTSFYSPFFKSTMPNGSPPLYVNSSTKVTNLNVDLLDGQHASFFAPISSPTFVGIPKADTATTGTNTTQLATTAFVSNSLSQITEW